MGKRMGKRTHLAAIDYKLYTVSIAQTFSVRGILATTRVVFASVDEFKSGFSESRSRVFKSRVVNQHYIIYYIHSIKSVQKHGARRIFHQTL